MVNADGIDSLIAAVVLVAVEDYRTGYNRADRPCPAAFLEACGLLVDGQLDKRFSTKPITRTGRPSHRKIAA
jgi:hypothetical protein